MSPAGQLAVSAQFAAGRVEVLGVALNRPPVARLFIGQNPETVIKAVPALYSLCLSAQGAAARAAVAAARGEVMGAVDEGALWREFLHENLWRLLLDWPAALGLPVARAEFVAWRSRRAGEQCVLATQALLNGALSTLVKKCLEKLVDRNELLVTAWPALAPEAWLPDRDGQAASQYQSRLHHPASVAQALRQRLADVALAARALAAGLPYPCAAAGVDGWGIGQVLTARGVLTHAVQLENDWVKKYQVRAPTDCHFADPRSLQVLLDGQCFATLAEARSALNLAVLALDPCLPYEVELSHA